MSSFSVYDLLKHAGKDAPKEYTFYLKGDLQSMAEQKEIMVYNGFAVEQSDVYPVLLEKDKKAALTLIWRGRIAGWWLYEKDLVREGVCTKEEFQAETKKIKDEKIQNTIEYLKKKKDENINTVPEIKRRLRF